LRGNKLLINGVAGPNSWWDINDQSYLVSGDELYCLRDHDAAWEHYGDGGSHSDGNDYSGRNLWASG